MQIFQNLTKLQSTKLLQQLRNILQKTKLHTYLQVLDNTSQHFSILCTTIQHFTKLYKTLHTCSQLNKDHTQFTKPHTIIQKKTLQHFTTHQTTLQNCAKLLHIFTTLYTTIHIFTKLLQNLIHSFVYKKCYNTFHNFYTALQHFTQLYKPTTSSLLRCTTVFWNTLQKYIQLYNTFQNMRKCQHLSKTCSKKTIHNFKNTLNNSTQVYTYF